MDWGGVVIGFDPESAPSLAFAVCGAWPGAVTASRSAGAGSRSMLVVDVRGWLDGRRCRLASAIGNL